MTLEEKVIALFEEENLLPSNEVAKLLGVSPPTISNYKKRHSDFPKAVVQLWNLRLYSKTEILAWEAKRATRNSYGGNRVPQLDTMKRLLSRLDVEDRKELKEWL